MVCTLGDTFLHVNIFYYLCIFYYLLVFIEMDKANTYNPPDYFGSKSWFLKKKCVWM